MKLLILTNVSLKETYSRDWIGIICLSYFLLEMVWKGVEILLKLF